MEEWVNLEFLGFPTYGVSSFGNVRSEKTGKLLEQSRTQYGVRKVGMTPGYRLPQRTVSVAPLVAKAFIDIDEELEEQFNTPINVNGNREDNRASNLMWRPRWFAIKYHRQFHNDRRGLNEPIFEVPTGEVFLTSWDAAIRYGLIDRDILYSVVNRAPLFPTWQIFRMVRPTHNDQFH